MSILSEFEWEVPQGPGGHEWFELQPPGYGSDGIPRHEGSYELRRRQEVPFATQRVFKDAIALYRTIAEVEPELESILQFVNTHGSLKKCVTWPGLTPIRLWDEVFYTWKTELFFFRECLRLWDLAEQRNRSELAKSFQREINGFTYVLPAVKELKRFGINVGLRDPEGPSGTILYWDKDLRIDERDIKNPERQSLDVIARFWIVRMVAEKMRQWRVKRVPYCDPGSKVIYLADKPEDLGGAIWVQLFQAIQKSISARRCEGCGRWEEVGPGKLRRHSRTCGQACRTRIYFGRKEEARQLYAAGKTIKSIARRLGKEERQIEKWTNAKENHLVTKKKRAR
jgi:hypothetical protein